MSDVSTVRACPVCGQKNRVPVARLAATAKCGRCKEPMGPVNAPIDADPALFDQVRRESAVPVLVDFWAEWCGPCRMVAPEVEKVASEMAGKAVVLKVDTQRYPELAARYGVRGIPNFVVLKDGDVAMQQPGLVGHAEMRRWLEEVA